MKYSIIVPIYNVEPYLDECINSVLNQTCADFELILVDDGSPDNCSQLCDDYARKDNRVKVVHKQNGGLVSARKAGLEIATGDYILCLDGDDSIERDCLKNIDDLVNKCYADVVVFGFYRCCDTIKKECPLTTYRIGFYDKSQLEKEIFPVLISDRYGRRFPPSVWGKAIKRELYTPFQNDVDSRIGMGEDASCIYPLMAHAESLFISEKCLYNYRVVKTSMTQAWKPLSWDNYDLVQSGLVKKLDRPEFDFHNQLARLGTHHLFNIVVSQFKGTKSLRSTIKDVKEKFDSCPDFERTVEDAKFEPISYKMVKFVLKHKLFFICYLYCFLRNIHKQMKHEG